MAEMIEVQPEHTLPQLLALIATRQVADPTAPVVLWVPRGIPLLRQMESYQAFKEATKHDGLHLKILSPDARVVGLALVFGLEAETLTTTSGLHPGTRPLVEPPTMPLSPPVARMPEPSRGQGVTERPAASPADAPPGDSATAGSVPPPAAAAAPVELSETDWLFGDVDVDYILRDVDAPDTRSATPPADVALPAGLPAGLGRAPAPAAPPLAPPIVPTITPDPANPTDDLNWLMAGVDFAALAGGSLNPAAVPAPGTPERLPPAVPTTPPVAPLQTDSPPAATTLELADEFGEVAAFDPFAPEMGDIVPFDLAGSSDGPTQVATAGDGSLGGLLLGGDEEEDAPAMSFSEWLALQKSSAAERAGSPAVAADVDLSNLPSWLRPLPAADAPPSIAAAPIAGSEPPVAITPIAPPVAPLAPKGTLRCPHCGEPLDPEEMLRLLAQVWGT